MRTAVTIFDSQNFSCKDPSKEYHRPHESQSCSCLRPRRGIDDRSWNGAGTRRPGTDYACTGSSACCDSTRPPQAIPAKIALVAFDQAVLATNEGQRLIQDIQAKYKPKKDQIDTLSQEVDSLKKQLQSAPATLTDAERATKLKEIDTKEKRLNHDAEEAQTAYNADLQEAYGKLAPKVSAALKKYVSDNGYTLLLDVSSQQSNVMWIGPNIDVTQAVVRRTTLLRVSRRRRHLHLQLPVHGQRLPPPKPAAPKPLITVQRA